MTVNCAPVRLQHTQAQYLAFADPRKGKERDCFPSNASLELAKRCLGHCESSFSFTQGAIGLKTWLYRYHTHNLKQGFILRHHSGRPGH